MNTNALLIEFGMEECPAKHIQQLAEQFYHMLSQALKTQFEVQGEITWYATPRRFAVLFENIAENSRQVEQIKRGPALAASFDAAGNPTKALLGFAAGAGVEWASLEKIETEKGTFVGVRETTPAQSLSDVLPTLLETILKTIPLSKRMRWGAHPFEFLRPLRWLTVMYGKKALPMQVWNLTASAQTQGHRFLTTESLKLRSAEDYVTFLREEGFVEVDWELRKKTITNALSAMAERVDGHVFFADTLIDEVTGLCEYPNVLMGHFSPEFLNIPQEALMASMIQHQKCFPVRDSAQKLMPYFLIVSNMRGCDENVVSGNEKVMHARLSDAKFFFETDKKIPLANRVERLAAIVQQKKCGSLLDKAKRLQALGKTCISQFNRDWVNAEDFERAALLCKTDLTTEMVGEFPELQGIMGRYYASHDGENESVARALEEHYLPKNADDALPQTPIGITLALCDKLDHLTGIFFMGEAPKSDKDPFGARRAALGFIKIVLKHRLHFSLTKMLEYALMQYGDTSQHTAAFHFVLERLKHYLQTEGWSVNAIEAVLEVEHDDLVDIVDRLKAFTQFLASPAAPSLLAAHKRVQNFMEKSADQASVLNAKTLQFEGIEQEVANISESISLVLQTLIAEKKYEQAFLELSKLKEPVDQFFNSVMILSDVPQERERRLWLVHVLGQLMSRIVNIGTAA